MYDFSTRDLSTLDDAIRALASGRSTSVAIESLAGIHAIDSCQVNFVAAAKDRGGTLQGRSVEFALVPESWGEMRDLLRPMLERSGFQWLCQKGAVSLLLSSDGGW